MFKALIIEDEILAARRLERLIKGYDASIELIARLPSVKSTVNWLSHNPPPDLAFMDIHLEDGLSLAIFEQLDIACPVILTTAFDKYPLHALSALNVCLVGYLPKPIQPEELSAALNKFKAHFLLL